MNNNAIVKSQQPQVIKDADGNLYRVISTAATAQEQNQIIQLEDERPAHYETIASQERRHGIRTQSVSLPKLPSMLSLTISALIAICFLVGASMLSISLTAYSNSVDRYDDRKRAHPNIKNRKIKTQK